MVAGCFLYERAGLKMMDNDKVLYDFNKDKLYVMLTRDDILKCIKLSGDFSKYEQWGGADAAKRNNRNNYGAGILNTDEDPYSTEREGLFGEMAFHILSGLPIDDKVRKKGNQWDFVIPAGEGKRTLDVKNTKEVKNYFGKGEFLIKNSDWRYGKKKICQLKSDAYFFTSDYLFLSKDNNVLPCFQYDVQKIIMRIHGAISRKRLMRDRSKMIAPSPINGATWDNIYIKGSDLTTPICFFERVGLEISEVSKREECLNGIWKGLESYV